MSPDRKLYLLPTVNWDNFGNETQATTAAQHRMQKNTNIKHQLFMFQSKSVLPTVALNRSLQPQNFDISFPVFLVNLKLRYFVSFFFVTSTIHIIILFPFLLLRFAPHPFFLD